MGSTAAMLEAVDPCYPAAALGCRSGGRGDVQIREAAGQLAADQTQREETSVRVEQLAGELDSTLARFGVTRMERAA
jgi:hypothetical protein